MLIAVLALGGAILGATAVAGLMTLYQIRAATDTANSAKAIFAADAGTEWALFNYYCGVDSTSTQCSSDRHVVAVIRRIGRVNDRELLRQRRRHWQSNSVRQHEHGRGDLDWRCKWFRARVLHRPLRRNDDVSIILRFCNDQRPGKNAYRKIKKRNQ